MRKPRLEYPGALYHVMARGNHRQRVFWDDGDRVRYLKCLGETLRDIPFDLFAYALMGNHVHLLLRQSSDAPLSKFMHRLHTSYTQFFNKKHGQVGHLFQGRYKSILADSDVYLLELVRYIRLNPIRAGLETELGKYPWSGHGQYVRNGKDSLASVKMDPVLRMFSRILSVARKRYQRFLLDGLEGEADGLFDWKGGGVLGDEEFEEEVHRCSGVFSEKRKISFGNLGELWAFLLKREGLSEEPTGWNRSRLLREAVFWMVRRAGHGPKDAADFFKVDPSTVTKALRKQEKEWKALPHVRNEREEWFRQLQFSNFQV